MNQAERPRFRTALVNGALYVDVQGRATQRVCPSIERLIDEVLKAESRPAKAVIDLRGAEWVDSTFAGWLVGLYRRLDRAGIRLSLTGCSDRCVASLRKMCLHRVFSFEFFELPADAPVVVCQADAHTDSGTLQLMLRAHEELMGVSEQNASSFDAVARMLRHQLEASRVEARQ